MISLVRVHREFVCASIADLVAVNLDVPIVEREDRGADVVPCSCCVSGTSLWSH